MANGPLGLGFWAAVSPPEYVNIGKLRGLSNCPYGSVGTFCGEYETFEAWVTAGCQGVDGQTVLVYFWFSQNAYHTPTAQGSPAVIERG